ncbi:hypothetical protein YC2023_043457 [Brassica napus]
MSGWSELPPEIIHMISLHAGGCGDDCHILRSRVYLVTSLSHDPPPLWEFRPRYGLGFDSRWPRGVLHGLPLVLQTTSRNQGPLNGRLKIL